MVVIAHNHYRNFTSECDEFMQEPVAKGCTLVARTSTVVVFSVNEQPLDHVTFFTFFLNELEDTQRVKVSDVPFIAQYTQLFATNTHD